MCCSDSLEDALEVKKQTEQMLQAGGFSLSKWAGSHTILCPNSGAQRLFSEPEGVSALGILWTPDQDILSLRISSDWASIKDIWKAELDWDEELLEPLKSRWTRVLTRRELYVFADASENAYAAAVYLRGLGPSGEWQSSLVAKTKVVPLKLKSIPRLELCGALLAARLLQSVADGLHIEKEVRWRYVSTQQNPADLATRGISVDDYKDKSLWWHGPS